MKITCDRDALLSVFQIAVSVVPARTPKPILRNVKLDVLASGGTTVSATDLELGVQCEVAGTAVSEPGQVILPAVDCMAILRELPDERIGLESTESGSRLQASHSRFSLNGDDPLLFPEVPEFGARVGHTLKSSALALLIRRTVFAAAPENSRYALQSVSVELGEGRMQFVATDGKRLAVMPVAAVVNGEALPRPTLLPVKCLALMQKVLRDPEEEVQFAVRGHEAMFRTSRVSVCARLVEGKFPQYQEVLPRKSRVKVTLMAGTFLTALRQAKTVTSEESRAVDFAFGEAELTLTSQSADHGSSEVKLPVGYSGDAFSTAFDPQLLIDALRVIEPEEELTLELPEGRGTPVLRARDGYIYGVMPLARE